MNRISRGTGNNDALCAGALAGLLGIIALLFVGCAEEPPDPLRIGINPWPGYEFLFLAREKGFFEDEDVAVELVELSSLGDVRRAFERGQVNGMATTLVEVVQARQRSERSPVIFMVSDYSNGADVIAASRAVSDLTDLKGRRVAAEVASLNMFILVRALERVGLTLDDVTLVPMDQSFMAAAFAEATIDAAVTYPPASFEILGRDDAHVIFSSAEIPGEVVDVVSFEASVMASRAADLVKLLRAWDRAVDYATTHQDEAYAIMARRQGITTEEFRDALDGIIVLHSRDQLPLFADDGPLVKAAAVVERVLSTSGQILQPDAQSSCIDPTAIRRVTGP